MGTSCCKQQEPENELKTSADNVPNESLGDADKAEEVVELKYMPTREELQEKFEKIDYINYDEDGVKPAKVTNYDEKGNKIKVGLTFKSDVEKEVGTFLSYNRLDFKVISSELIADMHEGYRNLKKKTHEACNEAVLCLMRDNYEEARDKFAFAYQARCCCDWIWKNVHKRKKDEKTKGHAAFVQGSRKFGMLAANIVKNKRPPLTNTEKEKIKKNVNSIYYKDMHIKV